MKKFREKLSEAGKFFDKAVKIEQYLCCAVLIILVAVTFVQVVMRSAFASPFSWAEEVTLMFLVWFGYLCIPLQIYTDSHASLYFLYNNLPAVFRKILDLGRHGILTWFSIEMCIYGFKITKLNFPKKQPATGFSQGWLFGPLILGGVLMAVFSIFNFLLVTVKPLSSYPSNKTKKTVDQLNVERGGTL